MELRVKLWHNLVMPILKWVLIFSVLGIVLIAILYFFVWHNGSDNDSSLTPAPSPLSSEGPPDVIDNDLALPIADFKNRISKKSFGIYVTPQNSPVQPERFQGFHTGVDVEYEDISTDVPVFALEEGTVVFSQTVSGYGGVVIIEFPFEGQILNALYGHLRPESMAQVGQGVKKGDQIGVLGTGYTSETDNERKHLHFAILSDNRIDLRGYVQDQPELSGWVDPMSLY